MLTIRTKEDFDKIVDMIRANVKYYESYITEVQYKLFLANKKVIDINYPKECIPHLLGLDIDYIRSLNLYRETNAYELMKTFLDDSYTVYSKLTDLSKLFSDYVIEKNQSFGANLKIVLGDIECVVDYKKDRVYGLDTLECPCEYYILHKASNMPNNILLVLGLVRNGNIYVPRTSQKLDLTLPKDKETLKMILYHQNLTFINALNYSNNYDVDSKNFRLDIQSKSDVLLSLNRYALQNASTVAVDGDYSFVLKKLNEANINQIRMKTLLQDITALISTGDTIDIDSLDEDVDYDIKNLVKAYNNSRVIETSTFKYSELLDEYNKLKKEVENLKLQNEQLNTISNNQAKAIEQLEDENDVYKETHEKILELLKNTNGRLPK